MVDSEIFIGGSFFKDQGLSIIWNSGSVNKECGGVSM